MTAWKIVDTIIQRVRDIACRRYRSGTKMWEFATNARALAREWRGCTLNEGLCESWQRNAMRSWTRVQTRRSRVSLAAISRAAGKVRKLRKKSVISRFPATLQTQLKRRERMRGEDGLADEGWRATSARHGRRALRTRVSVRECVTDVIILRNWEPLTDICKPHACESGPLARPVRTAICFWFDTTNCVAGNLLSTAPKEGWLALART